ncbi:sugar transferase [Helicobacter jaachi]|uniref:Sugar transferase n=1 Tax=Helicobacter jaachi TaxID=1677920 RepID=A0A4U8T7Z2_9HELI|nr:hypothetical protein [Helicobacter jaachi]TLD95769.1 sugar transferase [Helicobacter jaachi]
MKPCAPIVLFTYNRPKHTQQTLQALSLNTLAKHSDLVIYQDAPKPQATQQQLDSIKEVRAYLQSFQIQNTHHKYFKSLTLIERPHNFGLADSITDGVSALMEQYGRAIILEDDIVTSRVFLAYMNESLERYKDTPKVWSISAWSYPINPQGLGDCYFSRIASCWGWASWADRWQYFHRDTQWILDNFTQADINYINLDGTAGYFQQLLANHKGKLKTWAIFNYLLAYKHKALTLHPTISYIQQIGFDGSGEHCGPGGEIYNAANINTKFPITYPSQITESALAFERIKAFELSLKKPLPTRALNKILKISRHLKDKLSNTNRGG